MDHLLTVAQVASYLQVSTRSIRRWIAAGQLRALRLPGGGVRITERDAERLLAQRPNGDAAK